VIDRRQFIQTTGAGVVAAAGLRGCGDNVVPRIGAIFDVEIDRALVWVGGAPGATVDIVAIDEAGATRASAVVPLGDAGTGVVELAGLAPGQRHRVVVDGAEAAFSFSTAPPDDDVRPVRIAWSGDLDLDPEFASGILDTLRATEPAVFVSLGDWPYADNGPAPEDLAGYRDRHRIAREDPGTQAMLRAMSVRAIYDDHEVLNDWDAATIAALPQRHADGLRAWDEYFPVRGATADARYRRWRWGAHVECFLLDCRRYRAPKAALDDATKTMLGQAQRQWLVDGLGASTARWKLVFTTVPLDFGGTTEFWAYYATERAWLFDAIVASGITGVLFLSADQHWFASHRHAHGFRELQAGPLARGLPTPPAPVPGVLAQVADYNFGVLDIDRTAIRARCIDHTGAIRHDETLTLAELTPTASP
jgi:alkaline phosphatase D